jgi:hypothetical protein
MNELRDPIARLMRPETKAGPYPLYAIPVEFLTFSYPLLHLLGVPVNLPAGERES